MKNVRIFLVTLIGLLLLYSNETYATTEGTYIPEQGSGIEKLILIGVGILAVILVLFIGYKMDKSEENKKRREKFIKDNKKDESEEDSDLYSAIYNTINSEDDDLSEDIYNYENNETQNTEIENSEEEVVQNFEMDDEDDYEDIYKEINNSYSDDEIEEKSYNNDYEENINEKKIENVEKQEFEITGEVEDAEEVEELSVKSNENIEKMISVFENADSTMVFNSQELKSHNEENFNTVKGYDYEEDDDDLLELESTIKAANIKKFKRKKHSEIEEKEIKEEKSNVKRYTRKKKKEEKPKSNVKRYTRKKPVVQNEDIEIKEQETENNQNSKTADIEAEKTLEQKLLVKMEEVIEDNSENVEEKVLEKPKPKRGRPRKADQPVKPKRGRPRKVVEVEKPKRGRPRKTDSTKTKKTTTSKKTTTKK